MSMPIQTANSEYSKMMKWYDQHNIVSSKLAVRLGQNGVRGVFAIANAAPFEGIAVIPPNMIIRPSFQTLEAMLDVSQVLIVAISARF